ncbi:MAG TPA: hypothetical protein VF006_22010 [Longimicrobium sp.]
MKLKLKLEDLAVDSFDTHAPLKPRGTVFGEQCTCYTQCTCPGCPTCANYNTCDASCNGTCASCDASCNGTCAGDTCGDSCYGTCDASDCAPCWNTDPRFTGCGPYHCP